jgi:hypothetical protein
MRWRAIPPIPFLIWVVGPAATYATSDRWATTSWAWTDRQNSWTWHDPIRNATWFIILGRIYDRTKDAYSIHDFLKSTVVLQGLLLEARTWRAAAGQPEPEWLSDYLKSAWDPSTSDLEKIRSVIKSSDGKWNEVYKPIRDKVFAHANAKVVVSELFRDAVVGDIEDILHDLNKIRTAVFQLLENGREHWLTDDDRVYADPFIQDARILLARL